MSCCFEIIRQRRLVSLVIVFERAVVKCESSRDERAVHSVGLGSSPNRGAVGRKGETAAMLAELLNAHSPPAAGGGVDISVTARSS